jgi:cell shape-determining protein MreD
VAIGILLDLFTPIRFGSTTIALLVIYFLLQPLRQKYILNPNFYLVGLLTLPCTIIAQTLMIILNHFSFSWGLFYDGLYNALLATIFFFVLVKIFPPKGTIPVKIKV